MPICGRWFRTSRSWYSDNNTYAGATIALLKASYDQSINTTDPNGPQYVLTGATDIAYCASVTESGQTAKKAGPDAPIVAGDSVTVPPCV